MAITEPTQINAAVLTVRLLALLQKLPTHSGKVTVHRLRTTVRRLEARLGKCPSKIARALRSLRKRAGKIRDLDVHGGLLKPTLLSRTQANREALSQLRDILMGKRDRHLESLRCVVAEAAPLLVDKLPLLAEEASATIFGVDEPHARVERARLRYMQWTRNVPDDPERLHRLRINTKKLRYSLESLEDSTEAAELVAKFKRVQDAIGSWHDWATLSQLAERKLESSETEPLRAALLARSEREYRKARRTAASVRDQLTDSLAALTQGNTSQQ